MKKFLKLIAVVTFIFLQTAPLDLLAKPKKDQTSNKADSRTTKKERRRLKKQKKDNKNKITTGAMRVSNIHSIVNPTETV